MKRKRKILMNSKALFSILAAILIIFLFSASLSLSSKQVFASDQTNISNWDKQSIYVAGDRVVYKGSIYEAKWWTQGEIPGQSEWGPFRFIEKQQKQPAKENKGSNSLTIGEKETDSDLILDQKKRDEGDFKIVVYYPSWGDGTFDTIQFDVVTHINYAFVIPNSDGSLKDLEQADVARRLIKTAHKYGVKVNLAVGGWSYQGVPLENTFMEATSSKKRLKRFGDAIIKMCDQYGFDGVDMDWEHPRVDGDSSERYEALMVYLSKKLHKKGKILSSAVLSGVTADGNVYYDAAAHSDKVIKAVDWFNIMAYDGGDGERHSSYQFAVNCSNYWKKTRRMPKEKVVLGLPFYARPSWAPYKDILAVSKKAYMSDHVIYNGMEVYFNSAKTIKKKTVYAVRNLGGVMVWEITQDTTNKKRSLLTVIKNSRITCQYQQ